MDDNTFGNILSEEVDGNIVLKADTTIFVESFAFSEVYDDKYLTKFVKNTERLIRSSIEYTDYIDKLRSNVGALNVDNILSNITTIDADLEFHHYPLSLFDIVETIIVHKFINNETITTFKIAKEVMEEHFKNNIGLVPLAQTTHELAHLGKIFISKKQIFGKYEDFLEKYSDAVRVDLQEKIESLNELSDKNLRSDIGGLF